MSPKLLIVGAGGFGRAVAEAVVACGEFDVVGFVDDRFPALESWAAIPLLGRTSDLADLRRRAELVVVALGDNMVRADIAGMVCGHGFTLATVIHPRAFVSPSARLGSGSVVMAGCVIGSGSVVREGVILNYASAVDHDCDIGAFSHLGVGACMSGGSSLGQRGWLKAGCTLGRNVKVGHDAVVSESKH